MCGVNDGQHETSFTPRGRCSAVVATAAVAVGVFVAADAVAVVVGKDGNMD